MRRVVGLDPKGGADVATSAIDPSQETLPQRRPFKLDSESSVIHFFGASESIERLFEKRKDSLLRYARYILHDADAAEDIVQRVFTRLIDRGYESAIGMAGASAFLRRAVLNESLSYIKFLARRGAHEEFDEYNPAPRLGSETGGDLRYEPLALLMKNEYSELIQEAMGTLSDRDRTLIRGFYLDNLSYADISKQLAIKEGTVASGLNRASSRLRKALLLNPKFEELYGDRSEQPGDDSKPLRRLNLNRAIESWKLPSDFSF